MKILILVIVIIVGFGFAYLMAKFAKVLNKKEEIRVKESLVNQAFDLFLKKGRDYTITSEIESAILVKKVVRWAYFESQQGNVNALFSIETDKDVFCFQIQGENLRLRYIDKVLLSLYPQLAPNGYFENIEKKHEECIAYGKKIVELFDREFDFGDFGIIAKENIDFENIPRLEGNDEKAVKYSLDKAKEWAEKIEKNKNYFVNSSMNTILSCVAMLDIKFWENYRANEQEYSLEDCERIFKETYTSEFEDSLNKYLENETSLNIKEVFETNFKFFNYDEFIKGITVKIALSEENHLCVMVEDKYRCVLDTFDEFDENLNIIDAHNDAPKRSNFQPK